MIGRPPINRLPRGLLSALDVKSMGRNPRDLSESVQATYDLKEHYFRSSLQEYQLTLGSVVAGTTPGSYLAFSTGFPDLPVTGGRVQVPPDEIWYVEYINFGLQFGSGAGESADFALAYDENAAGVTHLVPTQKIGPGLSVAVRQAWFYVVAERFWVTGGQSIGVEVVDLNISANRGTTAAARIARFSS